MKTKINISSKAFKQIFHELKLHDVIECKASLVEINPIIAGALNHAFKLSTPTKNILLKVFADTETLPVDRVGIFKLQEELAILGLAPKPIYLSHNKLIYCEDWVEADQTKAINLELQKKVEVLAESLHNIHSSFVSVPVLPLLKHWEIYWAQIKDPTEILHERYKSMQTRWQVLVKQHESEFVLCHNDLHLDHVASAQGPFYDWEYAAKGCRYFDIANCASINCFDQKTLISLCHQYADLSGLEVDQVVQNVLSVRDIVGFTNYLWHQSLGLT